MFNEAFVYVFDLFMLAVKTGFRLVLSIAPIDVKEIVTNKMRNDGITINGNKPHDIVVHNEKFYKRVASEDMMGIMESYMDGWWDFVDPEGPGSIETFSRFTANRDNLRRVHSKLLNNVGFMVNRQTRAMAAEAREPYDMGNDLYTRFLDKNMQYTCGNWRTAQDLDQAQLDKVDLIARKLKLKPGMRVLEIGCGFGGLAKHLAANYGVSVVGYSVSVEQTKFAREFCKGLDVEFRLEDYRNARNANEVFDRVVSVGCMEHVGHKNYREFFEVIDRCLVRDGIALVHAITVVDESLPRTLDIIHKYMFPNGQMMYASDFIKASQGLFMVEDMHNFGVYYYKTLSAWRDRFIKTWPEIKDKYGDRFYRMFYFYLTAAAGGFHSRCFNIMQVVYTRGLPTSEQYASVR